MKSRKLPQTWSAGGEYWREPDARAALAAWKHSGLPLAAFARERAIPIAKLRRWKGRLGDPSAAVVFHRVKVRRGAGGPEAQASATGVDLIVRGGRCLRVQPGFDADLLRQVVETIEAWSC